MKRILLFLTALTLCASCSVMCINKKPNLNNTRWTCRFQEFVADAGNETVTFTLSFVSAKEYVLETEYYLPPYPAMRMNPDGTVDMMPGHHSQHAEKGTYSIKGNTVTLKDEDGLKRTLRYSPGKLATDELSYKPLIFNPAEE